MRATAGGYAGSGHHAMSDSRYESNKGGQKNFRTKGSHANQTMQIGAGHPLAGFDEENTFVTTNTVVKVDFIEGEYDQQDGDGF